MNGYTDLLQRRSTDSHIWGKKAQKSWCGSFRNTSLTKNVHFSEKQRDVSVRITLGECLNERVLQVVLVDGGGHASSSTECF